MQAHKSFREIVMPAVSASRIEAKGMLKNGGAGDKAHAELAELTSAIVISKLRGDDAASAASSNMTAEQLIDCVRRIVFTQLILSGDIPNTNEDGHLVFIDIKTTGRTPDDGGEVAEAAVIGRNGGILYHQMIKTRREIPAHVLKGMGLPEDHVGSTDWTTALSKISVICENRNVAMFNPVAAEPFLSSVFDVCRYVYDVRSLFSHGVGDTDERTGEPRLVGLRKMTDMIAQEAGMPPILEGESREKRRAIEDAQSVRLCWPTLETKGMIAQGQVRRARFVS